MIGEAKIGNFRLEFSDLQIPLAGIPVSVTRVYDTTFGAGNLNPIGNLLGNVL